MSLTRRVRSRLGGASLRVAEGNHPIALLVRVRNDQALRSSNQPKRFLAANN